MPIRDITGGYRAFRRQVLEELDLDEVASQGYCFQVDLAWRAVLAGLPACARSRSRSPSASYGESKMSGGIVAEALLQVTRWGLERRLSRFRPGQESPSSTKA